MWSAVSSAASTRVDRPVASNTNAPATTRTRLAASANRSRARPPRGRTEERGVGPAEQGTACAQRRRHGVAAERGPSRANQRVDGLLGVDPAAAGTARAEMAIDEVAIRLVDVPVDVGRDEGIDAPTIRTVTIRAKAVRVKAIWHGVSGYDCAPTATGRATLNRSNSMRRPREMRDITVPTGMASISAISRYENSSTSRNHTA